MILRSLVLCMVLVQANYINAQDQSISSIFKPTDSIHSKRLTAVCIAQGSIWTGSLIALNQAWYSNYPKSGFHFFNDAAEWNQVDKVGHAWSAYWGTQFSAALFRWSGIPRQRAALYGAGMGIAYVSVIEILDGYSKKWGFSMADMAANISGSSLFAAQELAWAEQRIEFKFSTHKINYKEAQLHERANQLFGASIPERILKDYNAQTYWLSTNLWSFNKASRLPKWLNIAVGYGAQGLFGGFENVRRDDNNDIVYAPNGLPAFDRKDIQRQRQFYLSPDIDVSKIQIRGRTPRIFRILNGLKLKFPMPTLEYRTGDGFRLHVIYF